MKKNIIEYSTRNIFPHCMFCSTSTSTSTFCYFYRIIVSTKSNNGRW